MMNKHVLIFAIIILSSPVFCQTVPEWLWANQVGSTMHDFGIGIATDSSGNIYNIGSFQGTVTFGTTSLTSSGGYDIFVAKLDTSGNYLWAKKAGGANYDYGYGIATDSNGNSYITGYFAGTSIFGTNSLSSRGSYDIYIAKLDTSGNFIWAKQAGGSDEDIGQAIAIDANGISYVTGVFKSVATFGTISLNSHGDQDIFITKLDSNGTFLWAKQAGGSGRDSGYGIDTDNNGNSYLTGIFTGSASFGATMLTNSEGTDIFITKLHSNGDILWARQAGGSIDNYGRGIATDSGGNSYVTGYFYDTASFGTTSLSSSGIHDIFITKLDSSGNFLWAKQAGSTNDDNGGAIAIDSNGNSYVTGYFNEIATFGAITLTSSGSRDIFVTKLDSSGIYLWAKQAGGSLQDSGGNIATDSIGNCYTTGQFQGTATFGSTTIISNGSSYYDIFIAKLSSDGLAADDELIPEVGKSYLGNAYPNPFQREVNCMIKAEIPPLENGVLSIYNLRGQVVESHRLLSGAHEISFSGKNLAPGIYFYRLKTPTIDEVKKLVLLR